MHQMLFLLKPGAVLAALILLCFLAVPILRGRRIPECFVCGATKVRPSRLNGFFDHAGAIIKIRAYRCAGCQTRFHATRVFSRSRQLS
jgi:hypothetical protein